MGYVGVGITAGDFRAQAYANIGRAVPATPIRLQPTVISVTPPIAEDPAVAAANRVANAPHNYVTLTPEAKPDHTMLYLAGAAVLAGVFLMRK